MFPRSNLSLHLSLPEKGLLYALPGEMARRNRGPDMGLHDLGRRQPERTVRKMPLHKFATPLACASNASDEVVRVSLLPLFDIGSSHNSLYSAA